MSQPPITSDNTLSGGSTVLGLDMQSWLDAFAGVLESPWAIVGFLGQALFFSRWIVQWIASERRKESHVPIAFWYISLGGGMVLFVYATSRHDPVFMLGQGIGLLNYLRNIHLIHKARKVQQAAL